MHNTNELCAAVFGITIGLQVHLWVDGVHPARGGPIRAWVPGIDHARLRSRAEFAAALVAEGVAATPGYIPTTVYQYPVFKNHNFFGGAWPVRDHGMTTMDYRSVSCPVAEAIIADCLTLRLNEAMPDAYLAKVARAIQAVAARFAR